jgi:hypothetical protein
LLVILVGGAVGLGGVVVLWACLLTLRLVAFSFP